MVEKPAPLIVGGIGLVVLAAVTLITVHEPFDGASHRARRMRQRLATPTPFAGATVSKSPAPQAAAGTPAPAALPGPDPCANASIYQEHAEFWGAVVVAGDQFEAPTAHACCSACAAYEPSLEAADGRPCTAFVYHPVNRACWLKASEPAHLRSPGKGPHVPWTSGALHGPHRPCADCHPPADFQGCVSKTLCRTPRACGSPAIDGYAHVEVPCLERSPTALQYTALVRSRERLEAHAEAGADYDGLAVRWGIGHTVPTWEACERACRDHDPANASGPFRALPCNVWTWCGNASCWEPDAHRHHFGDCWLKFSELPQAPEVNMRMPLPPRYTLRHRREVAAGIPWHAGVLLAPGTPFTNGTWGPRAYW